MQARQRLNQIALQGAIVIGAILGLVFGSWVAFIVIAGALIAIAIFVGEIRPNGGNRSRRR